jgi:cholesterol transport system auxiliary component
MTTDMNTLDPVRPAQPRFMTRRALCLGLPALLAGCAGSLLPQPPAAPARFTLDGGAADDGPNASLPAPAGDPGAPVLVVAVPRAAPGCDSTRMVYLRQPLALQAYAFHEWVDTPAQMLAPMLVQALQRSAAFNAVLLAPSAGSGALRLETDLLRLQQDFTTRPSHVRLTLRAVLLASATRQVLAWREFDLSQPAPSDDAPGGVAAAHQATRHVLLTLAAWCAEQASRR